MRSFFTFIAVFAFLFFTDLHADFDSFESFKELEKEEKENAHAIAYEFVGFHLVSSYLDCDPARLSNLDGLRDAMKMAVMASGATLLKYVDYVFPPDGLTMVMLLSESHASIHTYPEHQACFVDFFTCGRHCFSEKFDRVLQEYLCPKSANTKLLLRDGSYQEINNDDKNLLLN